jgi:hypothetical protein
MSASGIGASAPTQASTMRRLRPTRLRKASSQWRPRAYRWKSAISASAEGVSVGNWSNVPTAMQLQSRRTSNSTSCRGSTRYGETDARGGGCAATR